MGEERKVYKVLVGKPKGKRPLGTPRPVFVPKRDEVTGEWKKLRSEELHNLYSSPDIIRQSSKGK
jgi:hypothetical protein